MFIRLYDYSGGKVESLIRLTDYTIQQINDSTTKQRNER